VLIFRFGPLVDAAADEVVRGAGAVVFGVECHDVGLDWYVAKGLEWEEPVVE
jgi:hypothetical protein